MGTTSARLRAAGGEGRQGGARPQRGHRHRDRACSAARAWRRLSEPEGREKMKAKFTKAVEKAYTEKETEAVIDVYLTAFVMQ
ncbi:hypothetical protein GCM10025868_41770 [Angustibacter aerolatus]|uniref:Flagellar protein FliL n=1 Tax=Angustibacter aerolatus TaxID=1162965 RepID=A0ABQ6JMB1_9ACTN|nr:hypothetical protein GCM10025868_41770 [Angustibacter aerolatus]